MKKIHFALVIALGLTIACSSEPELNKALVNAKITVADSVDRTKDYSGIGIMIVRPTSTPDVLDTLFSAQTDSLGVINQEIEFPSQGIYSMAISRNNTNLAITQLILSEGDTLNITGELPGIVENLKIDSRENRAIETFRRLETGFNRVATYINAGALADSLIDDEVYKWSNLFWELHEKNKGTYAGNLSSRESIRLLSGFDNELMISRVESLLESDFGVGIASVYGLEYNAQNRGIDGGVKYIDSLKRLTKDDNLKRTLDQIKITALFDSSRVDNAKQLVKQFKSKYSDNESAMLWAESIEYDLNFLAPGIPVPSFEFTTQTGDSLSSESMIGKPYILEISPLSSIQYQEQYDRSMVIKQIYQNYNLEIVTVPLDENQDLVNAFYEEINPLGPVALLGSFDVQKLIEDFNITRVPTRVLVDRNGVIVKKYVGEEYQDIIKGLNKIVRQNGNVGS